MCSNRFPAESEVVGGEEQLWQEEDNTGKNRRAKGDELFGSGKEETAGWRLVLVAWRLQLHIHKSYALLVWASLRNSGTESSSFSRTDAEAQFWKQ